MYKIVKQTITTEWVDEETGEIFKDSREFKEDSIKKPRASSGSSSKSKVDENPDPILRLEENKYILTTGAVDALGVEPGETIDIKFQKFKKKTYPVIGTSEAWGTKAGNKLTKTNTVSCRGKVNDELSNYGTEFTLEPHPNKGGLFILRGENTPEVVIETTPEPEPEEDFEVPEVDVVEDGGNEEEIGDDDFNFEL